MGYKVDSAISLSDLRYRCTKIDLFDLEVPWELNGMASCAWIGLGKGGFRLGLTQGKSVIVAPTILGEWEVQLRKKGKENPLTLKRDLPSAIKTAEAYIKTHFEDQLTLVRRDSHWRRQPASEKQIKLLQGKKIEAPEGLTKGQASHLIGMLP